MCKIYLSYVPHLKTAESASTNEKCEATKATNAVIRYVNPLTSAPAEKG